MSSANYSAFPEDSEFDLQTLHLSGQSTDLFDFFEDGEDGDERLFANSRNSLDLGASLRLFANSRGSCDLEALLADSRGSAAMDFQEFDNIESSLNNMQVDAVQDNDSMRHSYSSSSSGRRSQRDRPQSPQAGKRFQMSEVSFDPPTLQPKRQTSHGDLSMASFATAPCSPMPNTNNPQLQPVSEGGYNEALRNLAESMKRTEESRRHVMMQRNMLTMAEQHAICSAKEQLQQQQQVNTPQDDQHMQQQQMQQGNTSQDDRGQGSTRSLSQSQERSSIMAAFFSGSRGTLTNGLDQSRRQLSMYMGQMNDRTI